MPRDRRLQAICQALLKQPELGLTLDDWGLRVGASSRTLARLFAQELQMSFHEWRQQLRLTEACRACWPATACRWSPATSATAVRGPSAACSAACSAKPARLPGATGATGTGQGPRGLMPHGATPSNGESADNACGVIRLPSFSRAHPPAPVGRITAARLSAEPAWMVQGGNARIDALRRNTEHWRIGGQKEALQRRALGKRAPERPDGIVDQCGTPSPAALMNRRISQAATPRANTLAVQIPASQAGVARALAWPRYLVRDDSAYGPYAAPPQ